MFPFKLPHAAPAEYQIGAGAGSAWDRLHCVERVTVALHSLFLVETRRSKFLHNSVLFTTMSANPLACTRTTISTRMHFHYRRRKQSFFYHCNSNIIFSRIGCRTTARHTRAPKQFLFAICVVGCFRTLFMKLGF